MSSWQYATCVEAGVIAILFLFVLFPMKRAMRGMADALGLRFQWYHHLPHCPHCGRSVVLTYRNYYRCVIAARAYPGLINLDTHDMQVIERGRLAGATCA